MSAIQNVDTCRLSRGKKYSLPAITASERGKITGVEATVDSHLIKCPICSGKCHMCSAESLGRTPQHSFSLTSAAVPEVEMEDLQCSGLAWFTSSFIYHQQATTLIQPRSCINCSTQFKCAQALD